MDNMNYESENHGNGPRPDASAEPKPNEELIALILSKIDTITNQTSYLSDAINGIREKDWYDLDNDAAIKAMDSIVDIVRHREDTNKSVIGILQKMSDNLLFKEGKKKFGPDELKRLGIDFVEIIEHMPPENQMHLVREMLNM